MRLFFKIFFIIAILMFLFFLSIILSPQGITSWESDYYASFDKNEKNIFLVGSSVAGFIDESYLENYLQDYDIYNLGILGDLPKFRIGSIDTVLEAQPDNIVYVLTFRTFRASGSPYNDGLIPTPKPSTLPSEYLKQPYLQNFCKFGTCDNIPVNTPDHLELIRYAWENYWKVDTNSKNAERFEEMVSKITATDTNLIILINPVHDIYHENLPDDQKSEFYQFVNRISHTYDVPIVDLSNRYSDLNIWYDPIHIGTSPDSQIFFQGIANGIKSHLK